MRSRNLLVSLVAAAGAGLGQVAQQRPYVQASSYRRGRHARSRHGDEGRAGDKLARMAEEGRLTLRGGARR